MPHPAPRLGRLAVSAAGFVLLDGQPLMMAPKVRACLRLLLRHAPEPVAKAAFAEEVWDGQPMSDAALTRCITEARRTIPLRAGVTILAVYGYGYQLATVRMLPPPQASNSRRGRALPSQRRGPGPR
jgi:DNA-binding winged helix-turn-helix (wHTH) protein